MVPGLGVFETEEVTLGFRSPFGVLKWILNDSSSGWGAGTGRETLDDPKASHNKIIVYLWWIL